MGLLSPQVSKTGLMAALAALAQQQQRPQADAADEAMFARNPNGRMGASMPAPSAQQQALSNAKNPTPAPQQGLLAPPQQPQRGRVSGLRIIDRVLGGQTITEGLDAERERLTAEAMRPQMLARQEQMRAAAEQMGPAALIAFQTNPEAFGSQLAEQFAPQVIAAGGIQSIAGTGQRTGALASREFGDRIATTDPITGQTTYSDPRPATFQEETARINANNPVNVAQNGLLVDPRTGATIATGVQRPDLTSVAPGGQIYATDASGATSLVGESTAQRPLTATDRTRIREDQDAIQTAETINGNLDTLLGQIDSGALNLGPMTNLVSQGRNAAGMSDQNSRNFASFRASLEKLRNDSLRLNTGVQTDGDSQRAWAELVANINDEGVVRQRLAEIRQINARAIEYRRARIEESGGGQTAATRAPAAPSPEQARAILRSRGVPGY